MVFDFFLSAFAAESGDDRWLRLFHEGDRKTLEACYREHVTRVLRAASKVLRDVDAETVTHEVFYRVLTERSMREGFKGGDLGAWLATVARRRSIDVLRRLKREVVARGSDPDLEAPSSDPERESDAADAKLLVERFQREALPEKYARLFEVRFLRQLPQREAAKELGMQRSTLAYQEQQVRKLLERFVLGGDKERAR